MFGCFSEAFWGAGKIAKDLRMTNVVLHFLKKGERREEEEKKG